MLNLVPKWSTDKYRLTAPLLQEQIESIHQMVIEIIRRPKFSILYDSVFMPFFLQIDDSGLLCLQKMTSLSRKSPLKNYLTLIFYKPETFSVKVH